MAEFKEKLEVSKHTVAIRLDVPILLHRKVFAHKYHLTGQKGIRQTYSDAFIDLLEGATQDISVINAED